MKLITYSDLHLEFGYNFKPPKDSDADLMILAGDIITFKNFEPLNNFLSDWEKPILFVAGNHEYYTKQPIEAGELAFKEYISAHNSNLTWLNNSESILNDVHFFGGTMWTDFDRLNQDAMRSAGGAMNDFRQILSVSGQFLLPSDTVRMHNVFKEKLIVWLERNRDKKRVVISHHAPVKNLNTKYSNSVLQPAFNSLDMVEIIEKYQPDLWIYGHTHECDDQKIGKTRIISNQRGYPNNYGGFECDGFDAAGLKIAV